MIAETTQLTVTSSSSPPSSDEPIRLLPPESLQERFDWLCSQCRQMGEAGDLDGAWEMAEEAVDVARRIGDRNLIELALCRRSAVAIWSGQIDAELQDLRQILMGNRCPQTSYHAAYNLSQAYEFKNQYKKALFYARIARDRAQATDNPEFLAKSYNQIGIGLSAESYFDEATDEFDKALALLPPELTVVRAMAMANRAYCQLVLGATKAGFTNLFSSLRWMLRNDQQFYAAWPHLILSFGYLELGRLRRAWQHGRKGVEVAEESGNPDALKAGLFLLGEVEKSAGDEEAAYGYYSEMQERFYPENPELPRLMTVVGLRKVVNLRA